MTYSKQQIHDISGLSLRMIQFYTEEKIILPEKNTGKGRGNIRKYSKQSLIEFLIIKELSYYGVTKPYLKVFLWYVRSNQFTNQYSDYNLYKKGTKIFLYLYITKDNKAAIDFKMIASATKTALLSVKDMKKYQSCLVVDYGRIVEKAAKE